MTIMLTIMGDAVVVIPTQALPCTHDLSSLGELECIGIYMYFCLLAVAVLFSPTVYMSCPCSVFLLTLRIIVLSKVLLMTGDVRYLSVCLLADLMSSILTNYCISYLL